MLSSNVHFNIVVSNVADGGRQTILTKDESNTYID